MTASGILDLKALLTGLEPKLLSEKYVFCIGTEGQAHRLSPIATFREVEGLTLVLTKAQADEAGLAYEATFRCITLTVHSSLEAVGLTAAVSTALAEQGISANVIAAYYHDHVFVPSERAEEAVNVLRSLSTSPSPS
ncbi:ACT domain-containing protein [Corallincola platygyrae]|uniref:ACT domain-containing protein n=1 Tax=Corallincola platygyrae TaxID=1193278 RepID=A0ABW4XQ59_9GAMM